MSLSKTQRAVLEELVRKAEKGPLLGLTEEGAIEYGADDCRARWVQTGLLVVWASTDGKGWNADKEWLLAEDGGLTELCVGCVITRSASALARS